jgi:hypothetical protein
VGKENHGEQWTGPDGTTHTVKSTDDPKVPDGFYHSQTDSKGNKATAVYESDYKLAKVKQNKDWK